MLALTDNAVQVIRTLTTQPELPAHTGLRIASQDDDTNSLTLAVTNGPQQGDQVIEEGGTRVYLEPVAASILDDKSLDAQVDEQGDVSFQVTDQPVT